MDHGPDHGTGLQHGQSLGSNRSRACQIMQHTGTGVNTSGKQ